MNAYKNKKLQKLLIFSTLVSYSCIFSPTQDSNALMKFLRGLASRLNLTRNSRSSTTIPGLSNQQGKFTPLTPTTSLSPKTTLKVSSQINNKALQLNHQSSSVMKLQTEIKISQSNITSSKDYKSFLETRIKNSSNPNIKQLLNLELINVNIKIDNLENQHTKLQNQFRRIQNNN